MLAEARGQQKDANPSDSWFALFSKYEKLREEGEKESMAGQLETWGTGNMPRNM